MAVLHCSTEPLVNTVLSSSCSPDGAKLCSCGDGSFHVDMGLKSGTRPPGTRVQIYGAKGVAGQRVTDLAALS